MKRKKSRKLVKITFFLIVILSVIVGLYFYSKQIEKDKIEQNKQQQIEKNNHKKEEIESHFSENAEVNKDTELYVSNNSKYETAGAISKKFKVQLEPLKITYDTEYFKIKGTDYYVKYSDVDKSTEFVPDKRYKKYVVFNENVVSKDSITFYRTDGSYIKLNKSFDLPIYIKDNDKYYVEYNDELFYVNKSDVKEIKKANNTNTKIRSKIRVLTYHTIYNTKTEQCTNSSICHPIEQFDSHMKYLSENNYFTLTMKELEMYLDKKIQIPEKSIVVTLDDGKYAINAVNIVEKYKINATYFMITSRHEIPKVKTTYMEYQSHTHNLHNNWKCADGNQGGQLLCEKEDVILQDLKKSKEIIGGDVFALSYPFFDFNDRAIKLLKQSGFRLAFIGQYDTDGYSTYNTDRFKIRRKTIFADDTLQTFISRLK